MALYIRGIEMISVQPSLQKDGLNWVVPISGSSNTKWVEPDYEKYLDQRQLRRMSRILKTSLVAAYEALSNSKIEMPDFIITGTGLGCMEDTGSFLTAMIDRDEQVLSPTPFIQSTHNTMGSAIALALKCHGYNQTYVHGHHSFEHALLDALLMASESDKTINGLLGAMDEQTALSRSLVETIEQSGKTQCVLPQSEGITFLCVSNERTNETRVCIEDVVTFFESSPEALRQGVIAFLQSNEMNMLQPDIVMLATDDEKCLSFQMASELFAESAFLQYKNLCGEHYAASAFATGLAARIMQSNYIPDVIRLNNKNCNHNRVLIFNQSGASHFSLILLKAC